MYFRMLSLMIVLCAMPLISPAGDKAENPLKKAKIGDYVVYVTTDSVKGQPDKKETMKLTVIAKDEKTLTTQRAMLSRGKFVNYGNIGKYDLTKPLYGLAEFKVHLKKNWAEGEERLKIGAKTYDCRWVSGISSDDDTQHTLWTDKSVLFGIVKVVKRERDGRKFLRVMEIVESGSAK